MGKEKKIQLRLMRCIGYVFLLLAEIFLFAFLRSYFLLAVMVLLVVWPMISVAGLLYLARKVHAQMGTGQGRACPGDTVLLTCRLQNSSWWLALDAEWRIRFDNSFWGEQSERSLCMPVRLHGDEVLTLPLQITDLGHFCISSDILMLQDVMGLVRIRIPVHLTREIDVIPKAGITESGQVEDYMSGLSETEESTERGNDFAEVSDIREYAPGDRIRDIHWKLSAKKDILMVKERVSMAGSEMAMVLCPGEEKKLAEQVLVYAFRLGQAFVEQHIPVCLILWNQNLYQWDESRFSTNDEMEESFCRIYDIPVSMRNNDQWERYMVNSYPYLGTYLMVAAEEGEVQVVLHENA